LRSGSRALLWMTSIFAIPAELSAMPSITWREDHDDTLAVHGAAATAQSVAAALVGRIRAGAADRLAGALRPALQTGGRLARLRRQFLYQLRHCRRRHYDGAVCRRLERDGGDYGYERGRDGSPARVAN